MNWELEWGDAPIIFGIDFAEILAEGIECGMEELEFLVKEGRYCDACGEFRITYHTEVEEIGGEPDEKLLMGYELCMDCRREMKGKIVN